MVALQSIVTLSQVPEHFEADLFSVLGEDSRPDYRWLIMGPERSGSTFHKDPNATSAWNAVVRGSKKWILFPPHITPPGSKCPSDKDACDRDFSWGLRQGWELQESSAWIGWHQNYGMY